MRIIVVLGIISLLSQTGRVGGNSFTDRFDRIRGQPPNDVGREALIERYTGLIDDFSVDPRTADAMFQIAVLWESRSRTMGWEPDRPKALEWYRKAAETAAPGSETWFRAREYVARRLQNSEDEGDVAEARAILDELVRARQGDWFALAMLEHDLISQCAREGDLDAAERHCINLLNWYDDPYRIPADAGQKRILDQYITGAANAMVVRWATSQLSKAEREERIMEFVARCPDVPRLEQTVSDALERIRRSTEEPPPQFTQLTATMPKAENERRRLTLIVLNIALIVVIGLMLLRRWRANV